MKWITRSHVHVDRIACPWLITRFIDPDAEIVYVDADRVLAEAAETGGHSFDAPGAEFTHEVSADDRELCTFEVLVERFGLGDDPALARLATIVHAADVREDLASDPAGAGLLAIGEGGLLCESDDDRLLERAAFVYDALYAWCEREVTRPPR